MTVDIRVIRPDDYVTVRLKVVKNADGDDGVSLMLSDSLGDAAWYRNDDIATHEAKRYCIGEKVKKTSEGESVFEIVATYGHLVWLKRLPDGNYMPTANVKDIVRI